MERRRMCHEQRGGMGLMLGLGSVMFSDGLDGRAR